MTSPDGITWTSRTPAADNEWQSVAWGGPAGQEKFVAVAQNGTGNRVMTSPDGITWTSRTSAADLSWRSVAWGGPAGQEKFVAVAQNGTGSQVMTSPDGITWTSRTSAANLSWRSVAWGGPTGQEKFVAVAASGTRNRVMTSPDGITWTSRTSAADNTWLSVTWGGQAGQEIFVAVARSGTGDRVMTSPDGIAWTSQASAADNDWRSVAWGGQPGSELFVAVSLTGANDRVMTSPDGVAWTIRTSAADIEWFSVTWGGPVGSESFVAVAETGTGNRVMTSAAQRCPPPPAPQPSMSPSSQVLLGVVGEPVEPTSAFTLENFSLVPRYVMYPPLPDGLEMDPATGVVSGTPTRAYASTRHWISATAGGNSQSAYSTLQVAVAAGVPSAPRKVSALPGDGSVAVSWEVPDSDGGSPITGYVATASPGSATCESVEPACVVSGLTNGLAYTFVVQARNAQGLSEQSSPTNAVTPQAPSISIEATRTGRIVSLSGQSTEIEPGTAVEVWTTISPAKRPSKGTASPKVAADGTFTWQRRVSPKKSVSVFVAVGDVRSNTAVLPGR